MGTCLCLIACTERGCQIGDVWPPPITASFTVSMNSRESGFSEELLWYQKKQKKVGVFMWKAAMDFGNEGRESTDFWIVAPAMPEM